MKTAIKFLLLLFFIQTTAQDSTVVKAVVKGKMYNVLSVAGVGGSGDSNANVEAITTLTELQNSSSNKILSIQGNINLGATTVILPTGVILKADGGSITNGTLTSNATSKIDGDLLHYTLTVNGGRLVGDTYTLDKTKAGITEGVIDSTTANANKIRFNKILKQVSDLKGTVFKVGTLDAYFGVWSNRTNGTQNIQQGHAIRLWKETKYLFSEDTFFRVQPTNSLGAKLFIAFQAHNSTVSGGNFIGDRATHNYSPVNDYLGLNRNTHEYGSNLDIIGCHNFTLENAYLADGHGDGIGVVITEIRHNGNTGGPNGAIRAGQSETKNLMIRNVHVKGNRRNNMSIVDAIGVTVENCVIEDAGYGFPLDVDPQTNGYTAGGVLPRAGIDIEPYRERDGTTGVEYLYEITRNIRITNCRFIRNYSTDLTLFKGERVFVNNNSFQNVLNVVFGKENHIVGNTFILTTDSEIAGNSTDRSAISINNAIVNDAGTTREIVLGNTVNDNTIFNFPVGMRLKSQFLKADNNKIYDFTKFGIDASQLQDSEITNTKIRSNVAAAIGITATFGSNLKNVKFDNSTILMPNSTGVFFEFANQSIPELFYITNSTIKASKPVDLKTVRNLVFDGNFTDNVSFAQNMVNCKFINNTNLPTADRWFNFQFNNSNIDIIGNNIHGVNSTLGVLNLDGNNTLNAYLITDIRIKDNKIKRTTGTGALIRVAGNVENNSNYVISNNEFEKDGTQKDLDLALKNSFIYDNYNPKTTTSYTIVGTGNTLIKKEDELQEQAITSNYIATAQDFDGGKKVFYNNTTSDFTITVPEVASIGEKAMFSQYGSGKLKVKMGNAVTGTNFQTVDNTSNITLYKSAVGYRPVGAYDTYAQSTNFYTLGDAADPYSETNTVNAGWVDRFGSTIASVAGPGNGDSFAIQMTSGGQFTGRRLTFTGLTNGASYRIYTYAKSQNGDNNNFGDIAWGEVSGGTISGTPNRYDAFDSFTYDTRYINVTATATTLVLDIFFNSTEANQKVTIANIKVERL